MRINKCFRCTNIEKAKELGFTTHSSDSRVLTYSFSCQYRIWIYLNKGNLISFIHHSFDTYNMFMKMVEAGIVEVIDRPKNTKESEIQSLKKRIEKLESMVKSND